MDTLSLISAVLSVLGAVVAGVMTTWSARKASMLEHRLAEQRHQESKAEQAKEVLSRYREPLLLAAFSLQSRLHNAVSGVYFMNFLDHDDVDERRYARDYTVYVLAEYLCWVEILRREMRFLDLGDDESNRAFTRHLSAVTNELSTLRHPLPHFRLFRGQQRAIGELCMVSGANGRSDSITYPAFCTRIDGEPEFQRWFGRLRTDVDEIVTQRRSGSPDGNVRLLRTQHALIDLIDFLDPDRTRVPDDRAKLREPVADQGSGTGTAPAQAAPTGA
ncbi:hypothetical protein Cs7R123_66870 [Catellatospora sp. TT07R-123]|uniref:hypothetical protein n=1 Tax=Catellatospora sp. TT07R-123 TaxID=2733863 RepID=UPI001B0A55B2|nr:hypothetical protein [Catellatospora sp. TT07R-123]GHJ49345.1 hypothetical protein Cs7R123_66870 [Catellatospora sp. TT07R-123]